MAASTLENVYMSGNLYSSSESDVDNDDEVSDDGFDADEEEIVQDALGEEKEAGDDEDNEDTDIPQQGLANVMSKILQRKIPSNKVILAKALTDKQLEKKRLEKEGETETNVKSGKNVEACEDLGNSYKSQHEKLKQWENFSRVKPDPLEKNKERQLQRIATRGVVQLFNAVRKQQKVVKEEVKNVKTEKKKDQVLADMNKYKFLDILKGTSTSNVQMGPPAKKKIKTEIKEEKMDENEKKWNILREDYMMGAKMKDWNKSSSDDDDDDDTGPPDPDISDSD